MLAFSCNQDADFFISLLCAEGESLEQYAELFDFRPPSIKRKEFSPTRDRVFAHLVERHGRACMLSYAADCDAASGLVVDHIIPLSSSKLNKMLRGIGTSRTPEGKLRKAPTQSFGSNHPRNLALACFNCNSLKQNGLLPAELLRAVLAMNRVPLQQPLQQP